MKSEDALGWKVRIGFGAGDLAQNLVFSAVGTYLLFFSTDVVGLAPSAVATMFLVVQLADALWNPFAGVFIDRRSPPWGKYRSYLVMAGIPFAAFAVMCFANPFGGAWKMIYACAAYAGFTLLFTLMNVAYGALSASLSRDMDEITTLTAVRIFLANAGCLAAMAGVPMLVAALAGKGVASSGHMSLFMACGMLPSFVFMPLLPSLRRRLGKKGLFYVFACVAVFGMAALYVLSRAGGTRSVASEWIYAAQFVKATGIIVSTGYMWALVPEVIAYSERLTGRRVSGVINAIVGVFFRAGMALGNVAAGLVLAGTGYRAVADAEGGMSLPTVPSAWLWTMAALAGVAVVLLVFSFTQTKERVVMKAADAAQVRVADLWREFRRNGPLRWLALFFVAAFALMSAGNAAGAYFMNGLESQTPLAQEGIRWLVCVIPAILLAAAAAALVRYPLDDATVACLNRAMRDA
ncbi:MAG: MFS transporter [Kiritimatiellae bacterium]|nr:MFS transporter [Kiritimatiellia bacterium]